MAKDSLARGAASATFMGGTPDKNDPIEFHGTVAAEDVEAQPCPCDKCGTFHETAFCPAPAKPEPKTLEELAALYEPMNDRVLLRRVTEENKRLIQLPDQFKLESDLGIVVAVGSGMIVNGQLVAIPLKPGDKVRVGHYNIEDIEIEGETLMLVSAYDVRLKIKA